jgi:hypothetical protein
MDVHEVVRRVVQYVAADPLPVDRIAVDERRVGPDLRSKVLELIGET